MRRALWRTSRRSTWPATSLHHIQSAHFSVMQAHLIFAWQAVHQGVAQIGPNVWPDELPGFKADVSEYYSQSTVLTQAMYRVLAHILGQPTDVRVP